MNYFSGIIKDSDNCKVGDANAGEPLLDHAVTIIGYNTDDQTMPYWIVRNSLGTDWGEQGYFKV
jgi:C1A family cysteine protease